MDSPVHSRNSRPLWILAAAFAVCAALLRAYILKNCFDQAGLLAAGSHALIWLMLLSAVCFAALLWFSLRLNRLPGTNDCLRVNGFVLFPLLLAAIGVFFGSLFRLLDEGSSMTQVERMAELLGMLAAICMALSALMRETLGKAGFWLLVPLTVYTGASLLIRFQGWSHEPMLIELVPQLLTMICAMLTNALVPGFMLGAGHRRSTVLFGLMTGFFAAMALPDYLLGVNSARSDLMIYLGFALWAVVHALLLLRRGVQDETAEPVVLPGSDGDFSL